MPEKKSYIIELTRIGNQVKVTACDPVSGVEVSTMGPATARQRDLTDLAIKKLLYVLNKGAQE